MTVIINNRTDEVIRRLNVAVWTCVIIASAVLFSVMTNARASVSAGIDKPIDVSNSVSLDPSNRVATKYLEREKVKAVPQKRRQSSAAKRESYVTRERLQNLYAHLPHPKDLGKQIDKAAAKHGIDAKLLLSICVSESHLRAKARNKSGATGMCQIMKDVHGRSSLELLDYRINIDLAARIVSTLNKRCGGKSACVIQAYNTGWGAYLKGARSPQYLAKVRTEYRKRHTPAS